MDSNRCKELLSQKERKKVLEDALKTQNPVLIVLALELGAKPLDAESSLDEALRHAVCLTNGAVEVLETLLDYHKENSSEEDFNKTLVNLAEFTVDTNRVDCMRLLRRYGLNLAHVSTRYCDDAKMRRYFAKQGIRVTKF